MAISGAYFEVLLSGAGAALAGSFLSVSGLGMEAEYEFYTEGGSSYPRCFLKGVRPQRLVLEQGVLTVADSVSELINMVNLGRSVPLSGTVILKDSFGGIQREWTITGAHLQRYIGPRLDSNQAQLAVSRMELVYNGCC